MNRFVILLAMTFCSFTLLGQTVATHNTHNKNSVDVSDSLCVVCDYWEELEGLYDKKPCFSETYDGMNLNDFDKWIHSRVKYDGIGRVIIQFVVKADGTVAKVKVLSG